MSCVPKEDLFLQPDIVFSNVAIILLQFVYFSFFISQFRFLPYVGMVTIIMNDYPKFKVGIYVCVCI